MRNPASSTGNAIREATAGFTPATAPIVGDLNRLADWADAIIAAETAEKAAVAEAEQARQAALTATLTLAQRDRIAARIAARRDRDRGVWR